jgi:hypothetical protein
VGASCELGGSFEWRGIFRKREVAKYCDTAGTLHLEVCLRVARPLSVRVASID